MTQTATTIETPLDRMRNAFPDAYQKNNGWWAHDDNPRFDFLELPDGDIRIHSWTGRTVDDILSMGRVKLTRAALYAKPGQWSEIQNRDQLDLPTLADYMCLDWQWLMNEGYRDGYTYEYASGGTVKCIKLGGICTPDGEESDKHQVRLSLHKEPRFLWNQNTPGPLLPSGLHYIDRARAAGYLIIGEGNSDWATMTFHGIPFLGIPGADQVKTLDVELVKDIPVIYILEEPDQVKKLKESGRGFYKNMRQHLREHGYTGEIFSIRFMKATGFKDPSDLHKSIYASCKEQAEGAFRQAVHKPFLEVIEQAIEQAIPEGNAFPVAPDGSPITFEAFSRQIWEVPSEFLSPIQKMIVCYLFLYMRDVQPDEELGWKVDAGKMAPEVGLRGPKGKKQFLEHLSYLYQKMGILHKEHRAIKTYVNDEDEMEQVRYQGMTLYIQPRASYYTPRGYCVVTEDQHKPGGPRLAVEECEYCGSKHLKHYAVQCVDCGHVMYPPIDPDEAYPAEKVVESTLGKQEALVKQDEDAHDEDEDERDISVSASLEVQNLNGETKVFSFDTPEMEMKAREYAESLTCPDQKEVIPEYPNLGYPGNEQESPYIDPITLPQFGVFGNLFAETDPHPNKSSILHSLRKGQFVCLPDRRTARVEALSEDEVTVVYFDKRLTFTGAQIDTLRPVAARS